MKMRTIDTWLMLYGESHQNKVNKNIHRICVPLIMLSLLGLLNLVAVPSLLENYNFNFSKIIILLSLAYYFYLSRIFCFLMTLLIIPMYLIVEITYVSLSFKSNFILWLSIFIVSWIGQFIGHKIEGKKPSFLQDLSFLLIGPLWVIAPIFKKYRNV